jgi:low affinity Fe/Cu permease
MDMEPCNNTASLEAIHEKLDRIIVVQAKQEIVLVEHARRSTASEKRATILENHVARMDKRLVKNDSFIKFTMWSIPILVVVITAFIQVFLRAPK